MKERKNELHAYGSHAQRRRGMERLHARDFQYTNVKENGRSFLDNVKAKWMKLHACGFDIQRKRKMDELHAQCKSKKK